MPGPLYWIDAIARQRGLRYEPEADERWLRAWEPYTTLKVPIRYEHALQSTGAKGSISIARAVIELPPPGGQLLPAEFGTWIAIVQDPRLKVKAATTSDFASVFAESVDLIPLGRRSTGDPVFDRSFASFAASDEELSTGITPSLRRLLLTWRVPVHAETRPGGFIIAPVSLSADDRGLAWMVDAVHLFAEKAAKSAG